MSAQPTYPEVEETAHGRELAGRHCSASFALHTSAPAGMKCADCTIDQTPCPECTMAALMELSAEMEWLDHHCSFVANYPYCLGPFKIGELRLLAKAGLYADKQNTKASDSGSLG